MQSTELLSKLFEQQVAKFSGNVALMHGAEQITYGVLNARANQLGRYLRRRGVAPERRVIVCVERCFDSVALLLGIAKAGGAYVPVEPTFPPARMADILAGARASLLVTLRSQPELAAFHGEVVVVEENEEQIRREPSSNFDADVDLDNVFAVLFTSGTTSKPKGILMRTGGVVNLITGMGIQFPFQKGDTFLLHRSFTIVGSIWEYFGPLLAGARSTILSGDDSRDPAVIWKRMIEQRVTHIIVSPPLADALIRHGERYGLESHSLRFGIIGGEPVGARTIAGWQRRFPAGKLYVCYGITESMYVAFFDTSHFDPADEIAPVGRPFMRATVRILNETMENAGEGEFGEICVASPCISRGYLDTPHLTADRFVPDAEPISAGSRLYRTGDLGRWRPDGVLELKGRSDRQVKIRGFRVELDEVESVVRREAGVKRVVALAHAGVDGRQRLVAYLETSTAVDAEELRRRLRAVVPDYMIPALLLPMPSLPVNVGGKLDRQALERAAEIAETRTLPESCRKIIS